MSSGIGSTEGLAGSLQREKIFVPKHTKMKLVDKIVDRCFFLQQLQNNIFMRASILVRRHNVLICWKNQATIRPTGEAIRPKKSTGHRSLDWHNSCFCVVIYIFCQLSGSVSVRERCRCKAATRLIILVRYQRIANAADAPLSGAHGFRTIQTVGLIAAAARIMPR